MVWARIHVMPQSDQWRIAQFGAIFRGPYPTKDEAVQVARVLALLSGNSHVLIHDGSGNVEAEHYYPLAH